MMRAGRGGGPRSRACAIAAPVAPVPDDSVSPPPRSTLRAGRRARAPPAAAGEGVVAGAPGSSSVYHDTFVRFWKIAAPSISGPIAGRSSASSSASEPTWIAHCGLPIDTC